MIFHWLCYQQFSVYIGAFSKIIKVNISSTGHVSCHKKTIGWAVLTFFGYKQTDLIWKIQLKRICIDISSNGELKSEKFKLF